MALTGNNAIQGLSFHFKFVYVKKISRASQSTQRPSEAHSAVKAPSWARQETTWFLGYRKADGH